MEEKEKKCACEKDTCKCENECKCDDNCNNTCKCDDECCKENYEQHECNNGCSIKDHEKKKKKHDKHEDKLNEAFNKISELSEDIVKEILPIADNFERALSMSENQDDEFFKGFKMIYCNLISVLEKNQVKAIDGNNKPFDPTYHEAVLTEHKDGVKEGMVLEVMQKGYLLKDKVIRPAMVKVSI